MSYKLTILKAPIRESIKTGASGLNYPGDVVGWSEAFAPEYEFTLCIWPRNSRSHPQYAASSTLLEAGWPSAGGPRVNDQGYYVDAWSGLVNDLKGKTVVNLDQMYRVSLTDVGNSNLVVGHEPGGGFSVVYDLNVQSPVGNQIRAPNGHDSLIAAAVNQDYLTVGVIYTGVGARPFIIRDASSSSQPTILDQADGWLNDVNDNGIAVGRLGDNPGWADCSQLHPSLNPISLPQGCSGGEATAINNNGSVVGYYYDSNGVPSAFVSYRQGNSQGPAMDLNAMLAATTGTVLPIDNETQLAYANDINERDDIVGVAVSGALTQAFLLEPEPLIFKRAHPVDVGALVSEIGALVGQAPPLPQWGGKGAPTLSRAEREVLAGLATANLAQLFDSEVVRRQIQQAALSAAAAGVESLQKRAAALPAHDHEAQQLFAEHRRRLLSRFQRGRKTQPKTTPSANPRLGSGLGGKASTNEMRTH